MKLLTAISLLFLTAQVYAQAPGVVDIPVEVLGSGTVCADDTYNYTVIEVPGSPYIWEVVGDTIVSGQGTHSVFGLWDNSAPVPSIRIHQTF